MGYHKSTIIKGSIGELSKVYEEVEELRDAEKQQANLMILQELSDICGAIECFLEKNHPTITMRDLKVMSDLTKSAFKDGSRK